MHRLLSARGLSGGLRGCGAVCGRLQQAPRHLLNPHPPCRLLRSSASPRSAVASAASSVPPSATSVLTLAPPSVGWWLMGCSGAVFGMVVLGGITRLTRSGLSMTEWRPQGTLWPQSLEQWNVEFGKYKRTPEFLRLQPDMSLEEFKAIYFYEWSHRMAGRGIGFLFGVPLLAFAATGRISKPLAPTLGLLFALGGSQGLVGWWMVRAHHLTLEPSGSSLSLGRSLSLGLTLAPGPRPLTPGPRPPTPGPRPPAPGPRPPAPGPRPPTPDPRLLPRVSPTHPPLSVAHPPPSHPPSVTSPLPRPGPFRSRRQARRRDRRRHPSRLALPPRSAPDHRVHHLFSPRVHRARRAAAARRRCG